VVKEVTGVTKTDLVARLTALLEPEAAAHDLELVAVEQVGGKGTPVIRVLLDRDGGVDLEVIAIASRWVSDFLDEKNPINGPFTLEVSSPGVDRPLIKRVDFDRFAGSTVNLRAMANDKRKSWTGVLVGMQADDVVLDVDGEHVHVPFETIQKARLKGVVDFGRERGAE